MNIKIKLLHVIILLVSTSSYSSDIDFTDDEIVVLPALSHPESSKGDTGKSKNEFRFKTVNTAPVSTASVSTAPVSTVPVLVDSRKPQILPVKKHLEDPMSTQDPEERIRIALKNLTFWFAPNINIFSQESIIRAYDGLLEYSDFDQEQRTRLEESRRILIENLENCKKIEERKIAEEMLLHQKVTKRQQEARRDEAAARRAEAAARRDEEVYGRYPRYSLDVDLAMERERVEREQRKIIFEFFGFTDNPDELPTMDDIERQYNNIMNATAPLGTSTNDFIRKKALAKEYMDVLKEEARMREEAIRRPEEESEKIIFEFFGFNDYLVYLPTMDAIERQYKNIMNETPSLDITEDELASKKVLAVKYMNILKETTRRAEEAARKHQEAVIRCEEARRFEETARRAKIAEEARRMEEAKIAEERAKIAEEARRMEEARKSEELARSPEEKELKTIIEFFGLNYNPDKLPTMAAIEKSYMDIVMAQASAGIIAINELIRKKALAMKYMDILETKYADLCR